MSQQPLRMAAFPAPLYEGHRSTLSDPVVPDVKVIGVYGSFLEPVIYYILEATDIDRLNQFLVPGMKTCTAKITPVSEHPLPPAAE